MLKKTLFIMVFMLLIFPVVVYAQSEVTLPAVEVDLWPEYDRPGMLVIYHITLPSGISFPAEVKLRIPAAVSQPNAVAARLPDGSLINLQYTQKPAGDWNEITIAAATPTDQLQIEYYDDANLKKDGVQRQYAYRWPGDYAVGSMVVQVQQPLNASNMSLPASFGTGVAGQDGLLYYTGSIGDLPAGQSLEIPVAYQKPDDTLSVSNLEVSPSKPIQEKPLLPVWVVPVLLLLVGFGLIGGGVWWYWSSGRSHSRQPEPARMRHKPAGEAKPSGTDGQVYCQQCGKRASPGDRFCRACGSQLRISNGG